MAIANVDNRKYEMHFRYVDDENLVYLNLHFLYCVCVIFSFREVYSWRFFQKQFNWFTVDKIYGHFEMVDQIILLTMSLLLSIGLLATMAPSYL